MQQYDNSIEHVFMTICSTATSPCIQEGDAGLAFLTENLHSCVIKSVLPIPLNSYGYQYEERLYSCEHEELPLLRQTDVR